MQQITIANIPKKIFSFFTKEAEKLAKESRFKIRKSKLTPTAFIKALVATCFSQQFTIEVFASFLMKEKVKIRKQSLFERFNERTAAFLSCLISLSLKIFQTEKLPHPSSLEQFTAVHIIDSSSISLHKALNKLFKGSGGAASSAALKIQLMYDYLSGQVKDLVLTSGCDNDQGFNNFMNSIQKNALYLMDLGYFKLASFRKIIDGNAFFISRFLTGTRLFNKEGLPIDLLPFLSGSGQWVVLEVFLGARAKIPVRFVTQRISEELANRRRQKLKEGHRRRGKMPCEESLALQSWSIYITNTTEAQINYKELFPIYSLRWQIELIFKLGKSLLQIDSIRTTKPSRVVIEIYGKFLCIIILFFLCAPVRYQDVNEISFFKACKILCSTFTHFIIALTSIYRLKKFLKSLYEDFSLYAMKDIKKKTPLPSMLATGCDF
jgi:hypothetical protein